MTLSNTLLSPVLLPLSGPKGISDFNGERKCGDLELIDNKGNFLFILSFFKIRVYQPPATFLFGDMEETVPAALTSLSLPLKERERNFPWNKVTSLNLSFVRKT